MYLTYVAGWWDVCRKNNFLYVAIENHQFVTATEAKEVIDVLKTRYPIDESRVYATGFSMGGGLVCSLLNDDPTLFARALVVGASGDAGAVADVRAEVLSYHGADDDLIPVTRVKAYAEALCAKRPGAMKVEVLPKTGHAESEEAAYAKQEAWKWLFR